jgi:hypothetical protein
VSPVLEETGRGNTSGNKQGSKIGIPEQHKNKVQNKMICKII